jgi:hypothetical protein
MKIMSPPSFDLKLDIMIEEKRKISSLINSPYYFLKYVFIVFEEEGYRLFVKDVYEIKRNKIYKTFKGAKLAFLKSFSYLAQNEKTRPDWSHFYPPDTKWLDKILES